MNKNRFTLGLLLAAGIFTTDASQIYGQQLADKKSQVYEVQADKITAHVEKTMYGIFFEDINMAADGGVYAELIKNRSFEFSPALMGWSVQQKDGVVGSVEIISRSNDRPDNAHYATISITSAVGSYGLSNEGFRGIGVTAGEAYNFSVMARLHAGSASELYCELVNAAGITIGHAALTPDATDWKHYSVKFKATETVEKAHFVIRAEKKGAIDLDMISLFPEHTWKNRPAGLRADLVQKLAELKPGFLRFPGGCIVEGRELTNRYQWKKSIGDIDKRENIINRWNMEFKHRLTTDYYQTFGLGFFEYFLTAEDIGAEPLPILNCGMACQFNTGELVPLDQLNPYIQDALDLIEFANGGQDTKWGQLRAELGHPKPFNLKMMGVGNEQWGPQYVERWKIFTAAIKGKYPAMKIVSSVGPSPEGKEFHLLDSTFRSMHADILDEHYYRSPEWFQQNVKRYDNYDRQGPKIFAGEYAAQSVAIGSPDNKNNWLCAMSEAAFMTGLERNADVVHMASYAPLFAHLDGWQWTPDLIWFNNLKSYATPNYYVQQLFSLNKGSDVVPVTIDKQTVTGQNHAFASAVLDSSAKQLVIKFINTGSASKNVEFQIKGLKTTGSKAMLTILQNDDLNAVNSIESADAVIPKSQKISLKHASVSLELLPYSMNVIRVNVKTKP